MIDKFLKVIPWIVGILIVVNLLILDFFWLNQRPPQKIDQKAVSTPQAEETESCQPACLEKIQEEVEKLSLVPTPLASRPLQAKPTTPGVKVIYVPLASSGSTTSMTWADIPASDFYFDLANYPGAKAVRWEVSLQSYLSSDQVNARLYDVTNKRAVDGSDLFTRSSTYEYLRSSDLTIWQGNNLYRIQAKGSSGNTVNVSSPRLRILLE